MRKPGTTLSGISFAVLLCSTLMGCPVWSGDDDRGPGAPPPPPPEDAGPIVRTCTTNSDCPGGFCDQTTRRCVTASACMTSVQCVAGMICDSRRLCVPGGCTSDAQCTSTAPGLVCDTATRLCVPGNRCTTDAQCSGTTPVCLGGSCQPRSNQCQFDYQCTGSGQACVDGRCVVGCTAANAAMVCASGQSCVNNRCTYPTTGTCGAGCAAGQLCVTGACLRICANDAACGAGQMCDNGVCRVDTRPRPFCTMDSQCNRDSVCYNGACRRLCPMPAVMPDGDCMRVDVQFNLCRTDMMGRSFCTSTNEQAPQCARTADCPAGRMCVNARCQ